MNKLERKEYDKEYYQKNKQKAKEYCLKNKERISNKKKEYYENNKEKIKEYHKEYCEINKEKKKIYDKKYQAEYHCKNKQQINEYIKEYNKNRRAIDYLFKLKCNIRNLIGVSIKKQAYTKKSRTHQIIGCSYEEFKKHLERQFTKGMTWDNYGEWHLDHIYPVSLAKGELELLKLNHYTNFQPLWAIDNLLKGNKIIPNTQIKLI